jgi:hypothetical protein
MVVDWHGGGYIFCVLNNCPSQDFDFIHKIDRYKGAQFLEKSKLVAKAFQVRVKAVYQGVFENPCVGGFISPRPPRTTKTTFWWFFHIF